MVSKKPEIISLDRQYFIGVSTFMTLEDIGGPEPMLWRYLNRLDEKLKLRDRAVCSYNVEMEIYPEKEFSAPKDPMTEKFVFMACFQVADLVDVPAGCIGKSVPAGEYAVFTYKGKPIKMIEAYKYIFLDWLPDSGYCQSGWYDYAVYREGGNSPEDEGSLLDIYIPVKDA